MATSIAFSPSLRALPSLPWETVEHIYSFCDQETLASLSLVSFGSWELAGPILYEKVEITTLDGLASLLFLEDIPPSTRLRSSTSLLSRIRTLSLDIQLLAQKHAPFFDIRRLDNPDDPSYDPSAVTFLVPHRLYLLSSTLPVNHLILPNFTLSKEVPQNFLPTQVLNLLDVRTLTFRRQEGSRPIWQSTYASSASPLFVREWSTFERIIMDRFSVGFWWKNEEFEMVEHTLGLVWARAHSSKEEKKPFEMVFDFASSSSPFDMVAGWNGQDHLRRPRTVRTLTYGGVEKDLVDLLDLRVVVRVKREDEKSVEEELEKDLEGWMKPWVRVEGV